MFVYNPDCSLPEIIPKTKLKKVEKIFFSHLNIFKTQFGPRNRTIQLKLPTGLTIINSVGPVVWAVQKSDQKLFDLITFFLEGLDKISKILRM